MTNRHSIHNTILVCAVLLCCLLCQLSAAAQSDTLLGQRIKTRYYQIGLGASDVLDTYLSRQKGTGIALTGLIISEQQKIGSRWSSVIQNQLHFSFNTDHNKNSTITEATYHFIFGRYFGWHLLGGSLHLQAGPAAVVGLGVLNNSRSNANNPTQARVSLNIMPSGIVTWRFPLFKRRWALRYEVELPLVGIMFSPNYGQSYYELFVRGNYDHNVVPTTFVSSPTFRQQLTLNYNIGRTTTISLGYLGDYQQARVNNLKQHVISHNIMIGIVRRFQTIHYRP